MNKKNVNIDWTKFTSILFSIITLLFTILINREKSFEHLMLIIGFFSLLYSLIFMLDIKLNFNRNNYHNHSIYLFFPISRFKVVLRELFSFVFRLDLLILQTIFIFLCYKVFFYSENLYLFLLFILLFLFQSFFIILIFLTVKMYANENKKIISYLIHPFYLTIIFVINFNTIIINKKLSPSYFSLSPFHGLFYICITNRNNYNILFYSIIITLSITMLLLLFKNSKRWPL